MENEKGEMRNEKVAGALKFRMVFLLFPFSFTNQFSNCTNFHCHLIKRNLRVDEMPVEGLVMTK